VLVDISVTYFVSESSLLVACLQVEGYLKYCRKTRFYSCDAIALIVVSFSMISKFVALWFWWRHGAAVNALVMINEGTLRRAQLVLGWVTVCRQVNHLGM